MGFAVKKSRVHSYTTRKKGVCGGRSITEGTRIPVWSIIKWYKLGINRGHNAGVPSTYPFPGS